MPSSAQSTPTSSLEAHKISKFEFILLMGLLMALTSLSIDSLLPALSAIQEELQVQEDSTMQLVVSSLFVGLALGQFVLPPLSDSFGRKRCMYLGLVIFGVGCALTWLAESLGVLLLARGIQGVGLASARTITLAIVRDQYKGATMASVMSYVTAIFIFVPVFAPLLGESVLALGSWRWIFALISALALLLAGWFAWRMPETLPSDSREPLTLKRLKHSFGQVFKEKESLVYILALGLSTAAFFGFLNASSQILKEHFGLKEQFPLYMGGLSACVALASLSNGKLVGVFGMRALVWAAASVILALALVLGGWKLGTGAEAPLWLALAYLGGTLLGMGILFGNLNSLATEPLGEVAGTGAAVVDGTATLLGAGLGTLISIQFEGNLWPQILGFGGGSALCLVCFALANYWRQGSSTVPSKA